MIEFTHHVLCRGEIVDRTTSEHIARRVCGEMDDEDSVYSDEVRRAGVQIIHVPSGAEVVRYRYGVSREPLNCAHCGRARPWGRRGRRYCSEGCRAKDKDWFCVECGVPTGEKRRCRSCGAKNRKAAA